MLQRIFFIFSALLIFLINQDSCQYNDEDDEDDDENLPEPIVTIASLGQVRGSFMSSTSHRTFYAFRGIPYATSPIGPLRFKVSFQLNPEFSNIYN